MNKNRIRLAVLAALMFGLCCAASAADAPQAKETLLLSAAEKNDVARVQRLIAAGVDVNAKDNDKYGSTALMLAAEKNSVDVARLLIEAGADVNAKSNNGLTALWYARNYYKKNVRELLEAAGAR